MFRIDMLPAERGDGLWIEWGKRTAPRRIIIDGGVSGKSLRSRIEALPEKKRRLELVVVTHIDLDHIGGVLNLLRDPPAGLSIGDIWFNGYRHLPEEGVLGAKQGEMISYWIEQRKIPWNVAAGGEAVAVDGAAAKLPKYDLEGDLKITVLGPTPARLRRLRTEWDNVIEREGLEPGDAGRELIERNHPEDLDDIGVLGAGDVEKWADTPAKEDRSPANGSSIALVVEHKASRCLLTGDAFPSDLVESLSKIDSGGPVEFDAIKLSHHGGKHNTSDDLLEMVRTSKYLVSTNGSYYRHPDDESLAKIVVRDHPATLYFNYETERNAPWRAARRRREYEYETVSPAAGSDGLSVMLAD